MQDRQAYDYIERLKSLQRKGLTFTEIATEAKISRKLVIKLLYQNRELK